MADSRRDHLLWAVSCLSPLPPKDEDAVGVTARKYKGQSCPTTNEKSFFREKMQIKLYPGQVGRHRVYHLASDKIGSLHLLQKSKEKLKTKKAISEHITLQYIKKRMGWTRL